MKKRLAAILLAAAMAVSILSLAACSGRFATAATMHLRRTEGTVSVSNGDGKSLPLLDNLGLYSGYGVGTGSASYAWIDLDDVKLTKMDQNSEISIQKEGKVLDIELKSGSLFFNVTEPLEDDETMNIRTSTMLVGIRGTCGWVTDNDGLSQVYLLEGKVECSAEGQSVRVNAGEMAELTVDGELTVQEFSKQDIPAFVRNEADPDLTGADETPGPNGSEAPAVSEAPGPTPTPTPTPTPAPAETPFRPEGEVVASGEAGENLTWTYYSDGTLTIGGTGPMDDYDDGDWNEEKGWIDVNSPWNDYRKDIRTVIIGSGVTGIGDQAFRQCTNLSGVTIPNSVISIGKLAFGYCSSLTGVTIPNSVTGIGEEAFLNSGLTSVTIPNSVISIGDYAFRDCYELKSATIFDGVVGIGEQAFCNCYKLASITIPVSVTSIDRGAFHNENLTDVYYGGSEIQWGQIDVGDLNDELLSANIYYNSTGIAAGINWNGHIYRVYDISMTWEEAKAYCESLGGHLVTVTSAEEQQIMEGLLDGGSKKQYWIGLRKTSGTMNWVTNEALSYTNWDSGEPNGSRRNTGDIEQYVQIYNAANPARTGSARFKWNDMYNDNIFPGQEAFFSLQYVGFICEWDTDETYPGEYPDIQQTSWRGHRYQVFNNVTAWQDAEIYCESLGGHLATISCQEENDFIYQLMIEAGYTSAYFGLTDRDEEGTWIWVTGEPVTYTNWHTEEPNSAHPNENYGMFYYSFQDGTWNDGDFEWGATGGGTAFICEWDPMDIRPS